MARVLIADAVAPVCLELMRAAGLEADQAPDISPGELERRIPGIHGLIVRSRVQVNRAILEAGRELKIVGRAGIGTDNIDVETATRRGVLVMNTPLANVTSAAEHTFCLLLALARNLPGADAAMRDGGWDRRRFLGVELDGKVLGLVGLGKVGAQVARYGKAFGMRVIAVDPYVGPRRAKELDVELVGMDDLLARADFVSLHVPLTPKTRNLIDAAAFDRMKPTTRLINAARGGIVNEKALIDALRSRRIAAAAIDVYEEEPLPPDHPLRRLDNVILTPHLGASTEEAQVKAAEDIAKQFIEYFQYGRIRNAVNLDYPADPSLVPFLELADRLGQLATQLTEGPVESVEIILAGKIADLDTRGITANALRGVLRPICGDAVNAVNAPLLARERRLRFVEARVQETEGFNRITVRVGGSGGTRTVSGTLLEGRSPRLIGVDDWEIELRLSRHMLAMIYSDVPGIIGRFGTVMGRHGINIASMTVGRTAPGRRAILLVTVDERVTQPVLEELRKEIPGLEFLRAVELGGVDKNT